MHNQTLLFWCRILFFFSLKEFFWQELKWYERLSKSRFLKHSINLSEKRYFSTVFRGSLFSCHGVSLSWRIKQLINEFGGYTALGYPSFSLQKIDRENSNMLSTIIGFLHALYFSLPMWFVIAFFVLFTLDHIHISPPMSTFEFFFLFHTFLGHILPWNIPLGCHQNKFVNARRLGSCILMCKLFYTYQCVIGLGCHRGRKPVLCNLLPIRVAKIDQISLFT